MTTLNVSVQLMGSPCVRVGGTVLHGPPSQRHRIALLALLVDACPKPVARDRLMALLWPDKDTAAGRRLLNLAVHVLRGALGEGAIASVSDALHFDPEQVQCDLHELRVAMAAGSHRDVVRAHVAPFLDGFHLPNAAEFDYWLGLRRDELARAHERALGELADELSAGGDTDEYVAICRQLTTVDPHSSVHAMRLMRALHAAGDRANAIRHATAHAQRLRDDLGLAADPAVADFARQLAAVSEGRVPAVSVAVLPFVQIGNSVDGDYFADGMTEDLIAHLARVRAVTVSSRAAVMPFRDRKIPLRDVGRRLGAATVLDGSVRHTADRIRIVATLIDVETGQQVWSDTYDREVNDILAVQSDVALHIARALRVELSTDEVGRVRAQATSDLQAYRIFLRGRRLFHQGRGESFPEAIAHLERAVARDPQFAQALTLLSMAWIEMAEQGHVDTDGVFERAAAYAEQALRANPQLGDAHATSGYLKMAWNYDWDGAETGLHRALSLSPGSAYALDLLARIYWAVGRYDEALPLAERAQELDPLASRNDLTTLLIRAGHYDAALRRAVDVVEIDPDGPRARATLGWAYHFNGRTAEGIAELQRAVELEGRGGAWLPQLAQMHALAGDQNQARAILDEITQRSADQFVSPYHLAYIHTGLGEHDAALDLLERAVASRTGTPYSIKGSFLFAPLRAHPRFRKLMHAMNLE